MLSLRVHVLSSLRVHMSYWHMIKFYCTQPYLWNSVSFIWQRNTVVTKNTRICEYLSTSVSFGQHNHTAASLLEFFNIRVHSSCCSWTKRPTGIALKRKFKYSIGGYFGRGLIFVTICVTFNSEKNLKCRNNNFVTLALVGIKKLNLNFLLWNTI